MVAGGMIAAAVVALHFIVTREPRTVPLPTARFAPARPVRARARKIRLQDLLLLLLRVLLILAVGAALAEPVLDPPHRDLARIVLVDRSRAIADAAEVADSARALLGDGDALVLFDSTVVVARDGGRDSLAALVRSPNRGQLSPALIAALRTASDMREMADSFELAIISPLVAEQADLATDSIRALWPGAVRLVPVAASGANAAPAVVAIDAAADDPLRLSLSGLRSNSDTAASTVLIVRGALDAADSAWATGGPRALVHWPATHATAAAVPGLSTPWAARVDRDTVGAVSAGGAVVVAPFERWAAYGSADASDTPARVVARWADGEPAAVETALGAGCVRTVTIGVPSVGDLVLHPRFARLAAALTEPCGGRTNAVVMDSVRLAALSGPTSGGYAPSSAFAPPETVRSPLVPWLLAAALLFGIAALLLQRRVSDAAVSVRGVESA